MKRPKSILPFFCIALVGLCGGPIYGPIAVVLMTPIWLLDI